eukprot:395610_1
MSSQIKTLSMAFTMFTIMIPVYQSLTCTTGDCTFDCSKEDNCNEIICTDNANSCTINCADNECYQSTFYLAATINKVNCNGPDSCKLASFYCGIPNHIPTGFSEQHFDAHIKQCKFTLNNNAMADNGFISCFHNIDYCSVETKSNNDDFKESQFKCQLSPKDAKCILKCYNKKSCGSQTSDFICNASKCSCISNNDDDDDNTCNGYLQNIQTLNTQYITTSVPTTFPTSTPFISPSKYPSIFPLMHTNNPTTNPLESSSMSPITHITSTSNVVFPSMLSTVLNTDTYTTTANTNKPTINPLASMSTSQEMYTKAPLMATTENTMFKPNIIIAKQPTQMPILQSDIFVTLIRSNKLLTTEYDEIEVIEYESPNEMTTMSEPFTSIYTKLILGILGGIALFCSFLVVVKYKRKKQYKEVLIEKKEPLLNDYKTSTIDLTVTASALNTSQMIQYYNVTTFESKQGEETMSDVDLKSDETSDSDSLFDSIDGNSFQITKYNCDYMKHQNKNSFDEMYENSDGNKRFVINPGNMAIVTVGFDQGLYEVIMESDDSESEEMYNINKQRDITPFEMKSNVKLYEIEDNNINEISISLPQTPSTPNAEFNF